MDFDEALAFAYEAASKHLPEGFELDPDTLAAVEDVKALEVRGRTVVTMETATHAWAFAETYVSIATFDHASVYVDGREIQPLEMN